MEIDVERNKSQEPIQTLNPLVERLKSPQRMKYEAEVRSFQSTHGGLEDLRRRLGLSRRKICQLLLVDPSAWTRWTKDETRTPPHIYRALEWYVALTEKEPGRTVVAGLEHRWRGELDLAKHRLDDLSQELKTQKSVSGTLAVMVLGALVVLGYMLLVH
jgi:hypothetical protein